MAALMGQGWGRSICMKSGVLWDQLRSGLALAQLHMKMKALKVQCGICWASMGQPVRALEGLCPATLTLHEHQKLTMRLLRYGALNQRPQQRLGSI
jgi:hypothetical protein